MAWPSFVSLTSMRRTLLKSDMRSAAFAGNFRRRVSWSGFGTVRMSSKGSVCCETARAQTCSPILCGMQPVFASKACGRMSVHIGLDSTLGRLLTPHYSPVDSGFFRRCKAFLFVIGGSGAIVDCVLRRTATAGSCRSHRKISRGAKLRRVCHDCSFRRQGAARMIESGRAGDRCDPGQRRGRRQCYDLGMCSSTE